MTRSSIARYTPAMVDEILRRDFGAFIQRTVRHLSPGKPYQPNWHIDAAAYELERVEAGELSRLIINMPPRSLKSISASVAFPAFVLGHDPTRRIICVSYGTELAIKLMNDFRAVVDSSWYRSAFPDMHLAGKNSES